MQVPAHFSVTTSAVRMTRLDEPSVHEPELWSVKPADASWPSPPQQNNLHVEGNAIWSLSMLYMDKDSAHLIVPYVPR